MKKHMLCSFTSNFRVQSWPKCYCNFPACALQGEGDVPYQPILASLYSSCQHGKEGVNPPYGTSQGWSWRKCQSCLHAFNPELFAWCTSEFLLTLQYAGTVQKLPICHGDQIIQDWKSNLQLDFQCNPEGFRHYLKISLKVFLTKV